MTLYWLKYKGTLFPIHQGDCLLGRSPECPVVLASERDFWSRAEDRDRLQAHLVNAGEVKVVTLAGATHYAHLDRADKGRQALIDAVKAFLLRSGPAPAPRRGE